MASVNHDAPLGLQFREDNYQLWKECFPEEVRRQMIKDDLLAGESVAAVLLSVITVGLVLGIVSVLCTL